MKIREFIFIPEELVQVDDCTLEYRKKLSLVESEKLLKDMFGTTNVGILDCSDMSDEEIDEITDKLNSIPN